jgi:hypothetical protein
MGTRLRAGVSNPTSSMTVKPNTLTHTALSLFPLPLSLFLSLSPSPPLPLSLSPSLPLSLPLSLFPPPLSLSPSLPLFLSHVCRFERSESQGANVTNQPAFPAMMRPNRRSGGHQAWQQLSPLASKRRFS